MYTNQAPISLSTHIHLHTSNSHTQFFQPINHHANPFLCPYHTHTHTPTPTPTFTSPGPQPKGITDLAHVDFVTPPSALALCAAIEVLFSLQAVDGAGAITCTGAG